MHRRVFEGFWKASVAIRHDSPYLQIAIGTYTDILQDAGFNPAEILVRLNSAGSPKGFHFSK